MWVKVTRLYGSHLLPQVALHIIFDEYKENSDFLIIPHQAYIKLGCVHFY